MKEVVIGIDIGGTYTKYGIVDRNGVCLEEDFISKFVIGQKYLWIIYTIDEEWREGGVTGFDRKTGVWTTIMPRKAWGNNKVKALCEDGPYLWLAMEKEMFRRRYKKISFSFRHMDVVP